MKKLFLSAIASFALAACSGDAPEPEAALAEGVVALSDQFSSDFDLIDADGAPRSHRDFAGKVMFVYFGFTWCPDVCPGDVGVMSAALNALGEEAGEVAPLFISIDPERDTPERLTDYFLFDERIIGLTGSLQAAEAARNSFKVYAKKQVLEDSALEYTVDHSRFFYIVDRHGRPVYALMPQRMTPQSVAEALQSVISGEAAS